ncbi:MAG: N-acetyltransferase [Pseudobacteriovorax sp.]|nr:N-acetyltransferase [Pseudobacteriovorax sp.]
MSESYFSHETAVVDKGAKVGNGTKIWHFSHIMGTAEIGPSCTLGQNVMVGNNVTIGKGVKIQNNVSIYEGVTLEDYTFCGPSMVFTNIKNPRSAFPQRGSEFYLKTTVGYGASLGANCTIVCGIDIGKWAFVGAGTVVTKEIPDYAMVVGNPARQIGWMCECGKKLEFDNLGKSNCTCGRKFEVINDRRIQKISQRSGNSQKNTHDGLDGSF